jgi:hypothetical protein
VTSTESSSGASGAVTAAAFFACGLVMDRSPRELSERLRGASTERRRAE